MIRSRDWSPKRTHYVVWVDACFAKLLDQGGNKTFFPIGVSP
jgi:hypothetical protein